MNKKPINIYFTKDHEASDEDWDFLYPQPKTLFSELVKERKDAKNLDSFMICPAVAPKFKKMLVFNSPINSSYQYGRTDDGFYINPISPFDPYINAYNVRKEILINKPTFQVALSYLFFAEEPLDVLFSPPYFHKPQHLQYGACVPGEFDIGQWFRPFNFEIQAWSDSGEIHIKEGEPLFYAEFRTERPILMHRFNMTSHLHKYKNANATSAKLFGQFQTLADKYIKFKQVGYREKILTDIKNNLIDEEPYKF